MTDRTIRVVVDPTGAEAGSARVRRALGGIGTEAKQTGGAISGLRRNFTDMVGDFAQGAAGVLPGVSRLIAGLGPVSIAAAAGIGVLGAAFAKGVMLSEEFSRAKRRLAVTLDGARDTLALTGEDAVQMAFKLESSLAISKEAIIDAQASLATFSGVTEDNFERVIRAAADISAVFKGDLKTNTEILGRAIQELSEGNVEGLSRGLRFLGTETLDTIKAMAKMGDEAGAVDLALKKIEERIGGAAEADARGLKGSVFRLKDAWGELRREFAEGVGGVSVLQYAIEGLTTVVGGLRQVVRDTTFEFAVLSRSLFSEGGFVTPRQAAAEIRAEEARRQEAEKAQQERRKREAEQERERLRQERKARDAAAKAEEERQKAAEKAAAAAERLEEQRRSQAEAVAKQQESILSSYEGQAKIAEMLLLYGERAAELKRLELAFGRELSEVERSRVRTAMELAAILEAAAAANRSLDAYMAEVRSGIMSGAEPKRADDLLSRIVDRIDARRDAERLGGAVAQGFQNEGLIAAQAIGQVIGGRFGQRVQQITGVLQGFSTGNFNSVGGAAGGILTLLSGTSSGRKSPFAEGVAEILRPIGTKLEGAANKIGKVFGLEGDFGKTLGKIAGGVALGAAIGGLSGSKAGSVGGQIGGGIGSAFGPIGSLVGSVLGTVVGSLFARSRRASIDLGTGSGGALLTNDARGNKASLISQAEQLGGAFGRSLQSIAQALDGTLAANVNLGSIGVRNKRFVFDPTGRGRTKGSGVQVFREEADALEAALKNALRKGIVEGISDFSRRVLAGAKDLDAAVNLASRFEQVMSQLDQSLDPVGFAAREAVKDLDRLAAEMRQFGATADDLAKVEQLRRIRLDQALERQTAQLSKFREALFGEGTGVTALSRLSAAVQKYEQERGAIGQAGFNQDRFTGAGQEVLALAREIYGTATAEFQAIRARLIGDTDAALAATRSSFERDAQSRIAASAEQQVEIGVQTYQQLVIANTYLARLAESPAPVYGAGTVNGVVLNAR